jgi:aspartyl-tRNA(Asn)/glutamyl-tRNA(Gln) amidotransferase subunit A
MPWAAEDFTNANIWRKSVVNRMARFMNDFDVLVTPTAPVPPFRTGIQGPTMVDGREVADTTWLGFMSSANLTGQPAISVPAGFTAGGLPVGMQIVGRHLDDTTVLRLAAEWERVSGFPEWRPSASAAGG